MLRSMLSAGSALRNHQTYMDVIANNIANVNTTSYKSMRSTFHELLSQVVSSGAAPQQNRGGVNPVQVGLGMTLGAVDGIFTQGAPQSTGRTSDLAIQGGGFFVFQGGGQNLYSRDGALDLGLDGSLLNASTGLRVMGWNADAGGAINTTTPLAPIMIPLNQGLAQATQNILMNGNLDSQLPARSVTDEKTIANTVTGFSTTTPITAASGAWTQTELATGDYYVEIRNVAAGQEFQVVDSQGNAVSIAQVGSGGQVYVAGWQAVGPAMGSTFDTGRGLQIDFGAGTDHDGNAATPPVLTTGTRGAGAASVHYVAQSIATDILIFDSLGTQHTVTLTFTKDTTPGVTNRWTWQASSREAGVNLTPATPTPLNFSSTGQYAVGNTTPTLALTFTNGAANQSITLDYQRLTQLAQASELGVPTQDGYAPGQLTGFNITANGEVECTYANGMRKILGQVALANFANPGGLLRVGDNMFSTGSNSGAPVTGAPGTGGRGVIMGGYLEMANVDLAQQFTNMISAQRGFQANSRVISASDQMLQDLVNLVR